MACAVLLGSVADGTEEHVFRHMIADTDNGWCLPLSFHFAQSSTWEATALCKLLRTVHLLETMPVFPVRVGPRTDRTADRHTADTLAARTPLLPSVHSGPTLACRHNESGDLASPAVLHQTPFCPSATAKLPSFTLALAPVTHERLTGPTGNSRRKREGRRRIADQPPLCMQAGSSGTRAARGQAQLGPGLTRMGQKGGLQKAHYFTGP
jgi:hypothetical protein